MPNTPARIPTMPPMSNPTSIDAMNDNLLPNYY
jgi:hypothetical protein